MGHLDPPLPVPMPLSNVNNILFSELAHFALYLIIHLAFRAMAVWLGQGVGVHDSILPTKWAWSGSGLGVVNDVISLIFA